jgi:protein dithiol:quinone oxidoreductase
MNLFSHDFYKGKTGYFIGFAACFATVILALVIQAVYKLEPCPLCITQRIVFMCLGVLFLIAAFVKPATLFAKLLMVAQVITALIGAGWAIRHWWIQAHRESMIVDCGVGFDYMFENFPLKKAFSLIFKGTGDCAAIDWTFLGLSLPQLGLIAFITFGIYAIYLYKINNK